MQYEWSKYVEGFERWDHHMMMCWIENIYSLEINIENRIRLNMDFRELDQERRIFEDDIRVFLSPSRSTNLLYSFPFILFKKWWDFDRSFKKSFHLDGIIIDSNCFPFVLFDPFFPVIFVTSTVAFSQQMVDDLS